MFDGEIDTDLPITLPIALRPCYYCAIQEEYVKTGQPVGLNVSTGKCV